MPRIIRKPVSFQIIIRIKGNPTRSRTFYAIDHPTPEKILEIIEKHLMEDHLVRE